MFCRNCGKELIGSPEFCPNCGARFMSGTSFCPGCGAPTTTLTEICTKCGARVTKKTGSAWQTLTAGILDLLAGITGVIWGIAVAVVGGLLTFFAKGVGAAWGGVAAALSIVAIVGGVYALRKKHWGLALAGSICVLIAGIFLLSPPIITFAIAAIVITILGKRQFA